MKIISRFLSLFRPASAAKLHLSVRTTDSVPRAPVCMRHHGSMVHGRFFTRDAAIPTRDVILGTEPPSYERLSNGAAWTGGLRPEQSALRVRPETLGPERQFDDLDLSTSVTAEDFNEASRRFWTEGNSEPMRGTAAFTADRAAAAAHARAATNATSVRDQADHMNAAARAFWGDAA